MIGKLASEQDRMLQADLLDIVHTGSALICLLMVSALVAAGLFSSFHEMRADKLLDQTVVEQL